MALNTKAEFKTCIEAQREEIRELKLEVRIFDLNYSYLFDLVNDAACAFRLGRPLDQHVIDGLTNFKWNPTGIHAEDGAYRGSDFRFGGWSGPAKEFKEGL